MAGKGIFVSESSRRVVEKGEACKNMQKYVETKGEVGWKEVEVGRKRVKCVRKQKKRVKKQNC